MFENLFKYSNMFYNSKYLIRYINFVCKTFYSDFPLLNNANDVSVLGWIKSISKLKHKTFFKIQDGRSNETIQIVLSNDLIKSNIRRGNCVKVTGQFVDSIGKHQNREIIAKNYELLSEDNSDNFSDNPENQLFSGKNTGIKPEFARKELLHLRHRLDYNAAIGRIRACLKRDFRQLLSEHRYIEVDAPVLTGIDCEGAGQSYLAVIDPRKSQDAPRLSVSAQLHLEALALGFSRVYSLGPVFRADKSKTRFHLSEFLMLELESIDLIDIHQLCEEIERVIRSILERFIDANQSDLELINQSNLVKDSKKNQIEFLRRILRSNFVRISFDECVDILLSNQLRESNRRTDDFSKEEEISLIHLLGDTVVFVERFPSVLRPFYCKREAGRALSVDVLVPGVGEVVSGSVREDRWSVLRDQMDAAGLSSSQMDWYLDLRLNGGCPHSGFGLGFDRFVQFLTGASNIQDIVTFPRMYDTCIL